MQKLSIEVQGKEYPVKFGYGVSHKLGLHWGVSGILPLFQKALGIMGLGDEAAKKTDIDNLDETRIAESILQFDNLELIGDIVMYGTAKGLETALEDLPFERDALMDSLLEDVTNTVQLYMAFIMTMPRPKETPPVSSSAVENKGGKPQKKRNPLKPAKKG